MKCSKCGAELENGRFCLECGNEVITEEMIHQEKIEVAKKYADEIPTSFYKFHVKGSIPSTKINNAISSYASGIDRDRIVALYDTTITENGKEGMLFSDTDLYCKVYLEPAVRIRYSDIKEMSYGYIELKDGKLERINVDFNRRPMMQFVNELLSIDKKYGVKPPERKRTKLDVMEQYGRKLTDSCYHFYLKGTIPDKILRNAISKYATEVSRENVLGLIDTSFGDNGKKGILFTEKAMYQNIESDFYRKIYYKNIIYAEAERFEVKIVFKKEDSYDLYENKSSWYQLKSDVFAEFLSNMSNMP